MRNNEYDSHMSHANNQNFGYHQNYNYDCYRPCPPPCPKPCPPCPKPCVQACPRPLRGATGPAGPEGPPGPSGILNFADFYALMPSDNAATVAAGGDVDFPQDGPTSATTITRTGVDTFNLAEVGVYQVLFQVSVDEPGQLILTLNGIDLPATVVGRATGTSQILGMALVRTTVANSILTVRNPLGNAAALTITPYAGGARPVSAHLVITQLA